MISPDVLAVADASWKNSAPSWWVTRYSGGEGRGHRRGVRWRRSARDRCRSAKGRCRRQHRTTMAARSSAGFESGRWRRNRLGPSRWPWRGGVARQRGPAEPRPGGRRSAPARPGPPRVARGRPRARRHRRVAANVVCPNRRRSPHRGQARTAPGRRCSHFGEGSASKAVPLTAQSESASRTRRWLRSDGPVGSSVGLTSRDGAVRRVSPAEPRSGGPTPMRVCRMGWGSSRGNREWSRSGRSPRASAPVVDGRIVVPGENQNAPARATQRPADQQLVND